MENAETATELLMAVAERMGQHGDGVDAVVIWNTREGQMHFKSNCNLTRALGLAMYGVTECSDTITRSRGGYIDDEGNKHED